MSHATHSKVWITALSFCEALQRFDVSALAALEFHNLAFGALAADDHSSALPVQSGIACQALLGYAQLALREPRDRFQLVALLATEPITMLSMDRTVRSTEKEDYFSGRFVRSNLLSGS